LTILDRLFEQGEEPIRILGAFSMQLRRLAQASRLCRQGVSFGAAADQIGIPPFARQGCERQLRHLGPRTTRAYDWLLEADQGMKGHSQLSPRTLLERLLVRLK
jgi:DNA polymerase-3 subunit delta